MAPCSSESDSGTLGHSQGTMFLCIKSPTHWGKCCLWASWRQPPGLNHRDSLELFPSLLNPNYSTSTPAPRVRIPTLWVTNFSWLQDDHLLGYRLGSHKPLTSPGHVESLAVSSCPSLIGPSALVGDTHEALLLWEWVSSWSSVNEGGRGQESYSRGNKT